MLIPTKTQLMVHPTENKESSNIEQVQNKFMV